MRQYDFAENPLRFVRMFYRYAWLAPFLVTMLLTRTGLADPMPVKSVEKDSSGLSVKLDPGTLRLEICTDRIIRVSYSPTERIPARQDFSVIKSWNSAPFTFSEGEKELVISTAAMTVRVNRDTGALTFGDTSGQVFLKETPIGGKKMAPVTVNGESTYSVEQSFMSPTDEHLYGMSQSQDGTWNWRGIPIELRQ